MITDTREESHRKALIEKAKAYHIPPQFPLGMILFYNCSVKVT